MQPEREGVGSPGNRCSGVQDWLRGRGDKRPVGPTPHPPVSLKVGTKAGPEAGGAAGVWSAEPSRGPGAQWPLHSSACPPRLRRRWKLQVLDLRRNAHQDFWTVWSSSKPNVCSLLEPEPAQPMQKRRRVEGLMAGPKPVRAPVEVLVDLCLKEDTLDETLSCLLRKAKQRRGLLNLRCQKLRIFAMPMQSIRRILKMVQLDSVRDLEVNCTWKLATLGRFVLHLGSMGNLRRLLLSHIHVLPHTASNEEENCVGQLTSQFLNLPHLQELYLDSISFLEGRLHQVLR